MTRPILAIALAATALAALAGCGGDATAPRLSPEASAYAMLDSLAPSLDMPRTMVNEARAALALGAPLQQATVVVGGVAETFNVVAFAYKARTSMAPATPDSMVMLAGWRGARADEVFVVNAGSVIGLAGYPLGDVVYERDGLTSTMTAPTGLPITTASVAPGSGSCAAFLPTRTNAYLQRYLDTERACQPATIALRVDQTLVGSAGDIRFSLDVTGIRGVRVETGL